MFDGNKCRFLDLRPRPGAGRPLALNPDAGKPRYVVIAPSSQFFPTGLSLESAPAAIPRPSETPRKETSAHPLPAGALRQPVTSFDELPAPSSAMNQGLFSAREIWRTTAPRPSSRPGPNPSLAISDRGDRIAISLSSLQIHRVGAEAPEAAWPLRAELGRSALHFWNGDTLLAADHAVGRLLGLAGQRTIQELAPLPNSRGSSGSDRQLLAYAAPRSQFVAANNNSREVLFLDSTTLQETATWEIDHPPSCLAFADNGRMAAGFSRLHKQSQKGNLEGHIGIYDSNGANQLLFPAHGGGQRWRDIYSLEFLDPEGARLVSVGGDGVRIFRGDSGQEDRLLCRERLSDGKAKVIQKGKRIASGPHGADQRVIKFWELTPTGSRHQDFEFEERIEDWDVTPDGARLALYGRKAGIAVIALENQFENQFENQLENQLENQQTP